MEVLAYAQEEAHVSPRSSRIRDVEIAPYGLQQKVVFHIALPGGADLRRAWRKLVLALLRLPMWSRRKGTSFTQIWTHRSLL